eukprot:TRINITY_DN17531_c0_g1_i1.p2 TRINITY_DN17531_c0_g1~~TRINITY_DN17531_c0_g1_i1.p2  ORF type:complete len:174 (-),score=54.20 TRINITY_DN17531_c0_g1_i1:246-767(-)
MHSKFTEHAKKIVQELKKLDDTDEEWDVIDLPQEYIVLPNNEHKKDEKKVSVVEKTSDKEGKTSDSENIKIEEKIENNELSVSQMFSQQSECSICNKVFVSKDIDVLNCLHSVCNSCSLIFVSSIAKKKEWEKFKCPNKECKEGIPYYSLKKKHGRKGIRRILGVEAPLVREG